MRSKLLGYVFDYKHRMHFKSIMKLYLRIFRWGDIMGYFSVQDHLPTGKTVEYVSKELISGTVCRIEQILQIEYITLLIA